MKLTATDLQHEILPINQLQPFPGNARLHDDALLDESIVEHGVYRTVVVSSDGYVIAGNGTWQRAREAGEQQIAVTRLPLPHDDPQAVKINLVDNRANDRASNDGELLASLLTSLPDLAGTGYGQDDLAALLAQGGSQVGLTDPDDVPELPAEAITKPGDLWLLGEHRLLCGDASELALQERLLDEPDGLLVTDPPYGVDYGSLVAGRENQKRGGWADIRNDALDDAALTSLLTAAFAASKASVAFVWHPAGARRFLFWQALETHGWRIAQEIVWVKNALVFGRADYQWRHEPCLYAKRDGAPRQEDRTQTTVWEVDKPTGGDHPTQKPVELYARAVRNHTQKGDVVFDPFAGSGTAIIAAQELGRRARAFELDPGYCDVICRRFQEFTGTKPILESTGEAWDFTSEPPARAA